VTDYSVIAPLMRTDCYKLDHRRQYALSGNVTRVYSNYTNRKSRMPGVDHVVHFGLQAYLQRYLVDDWKPFFEAGRVDVCKLYVQRLRQVLGDAAASAIGSNHIFDLHQLGYLPLRFCALPEGTRVPIRVPSFTVENTHPDFAWLTNFVETGLSAGYWQASTSATIAHEYRRLLLAAAETTGADLADVDYQLHDFSYRGMSSHETAAASGAAHLLSFKGTDSLVALDWIDRYYGGPYEAVSVPATEHSVMSCGIASYAD
jgi:nicotinic acid phosphoribosyltransferase